MTRITRRNKTIYKLLSFRKSQISELLEKFESKVILCLDFICVHYTVYLLQCITVYVICAQSPLWFYTRAIYLVPNFTNIRAYCYLIIFNKLSIGY